MKRYLLLFCLAACATASINAVADSDTQGAQLESSFVQWKITHEEALRQSVPYRTAAKLLVGGFRQRAMGAPQAAINTMYTCLMGVGSDDAKAAGCVIAATTAITKFKAAEALSVADGGAHD